jgi:GNAT superfamily N-acetyltransferase
VPEIRRIRPGERATALATMVSAFRRDPQLRWWFPGEQEYEAGAAAFFGVLLDTRAEGGEVWVADGGLAVAMWVPPGGNLIGPELASARYAAMVADLPPAAAERIQRTDEAVDRLLPSGAHWYLGVLACRPDAHRHGLGWQVAAPVLAAADRAGLPVALETSSPVNVGYYTRRGFAVLGEASLGGDLPGAVVPQTVGEPALELVGTGGATDRADPATAAAVGTVSAGGGISVYVMRREPRG